MSFKLFLYTMWFGTKYHSRTSHKSLKLFKKTIEIYDLFLYHNLCMKEVANSNCAR